MHALTHLTLSMLPLSFVSSLILDTLATDKLVLPQQLDQRLVQLRLLYFNCQATSLLSLATFHSLLMSRYQIQGLITIVITDECDFRHCHLARRLFNHIQWLALMHVESLVSIHASIATVACHLAGLTEMNLFFQSACKC